MYGKLARRYNSFMIRVFLHLDIKPSNILIDKNGNARLIDFGVSKRYDIEQEETSTTMLTLSKGFASIEQYDNEGTQGVLAPSGYLFLGSHDV